MSTTVHIKNMVCPRCIMAVNNLFDDLGYTVEDTQLGWIRIKEDIPEQAHPVIRERLAKIGFELMEDEQAKLIEQVKNIIINKIHHSKEAPEGRLSEEIAETLRRDYHSLSRLFSAKEGITIERYIILQKTEKVKELLFYGSLSLSEIAFRLGYSSVAHISRQFKEVTGMTPSQFKKQQSTERRPIDNLTSEE